MKVFKKITIVSILLIIMLTYIQTLVFAAESELTLTPKPETNSIHLKWTVPQNIKKSQEQVVLKQLGLQTLVIMQQMKRLKYLMYIRQESL